MKEKVLQEKNSKLEMLFLRLWQSWKSRSQKNQYSLQQQMKVLNSLSPLEVVELGYSIATKEGKVMNRFDQLKTDDVLLLGLAVGHAEVIVKKTSKENLWTSKKS